MQIFTVHNYSNRIKDCTQIPKHSNNKYLDKVNKYHDMNLLKVMACKNCAVFLLIKSLISIMEFIHKPDVKIPQKNDYAHR